MLLTFIHFTMAIPAVHAAPPVPNTPTPPAAARAYAPPPPANAAYPAAHQNARVPTASADARTPSSNVPGAFGVARPAAPAPAPAGTATAPTGAHAATAPGATATPPAATNAAPAATAPSAPASTTSAAPAAPNPSQVRNLVPSQVIPPKDIKPVQSPEATARAIKLCELVQACNKAKPGKQALCLKQSLKGSGFMDHMLEGESAKDLPRFLRKEGFVDREFGLSDFTQLPDGSILVLDASNSINGSRTGCPKVYGNVYVKCSDTWIDDQSYELVFHMKRQCISKGIWVHPSLVLKERQRLLRKRYITDPVTPAPPTTPERD